MSKGQTITQQTAVEAPVSKADKAVLALARLLGRQAAREMATPVTILDQSLNGGSNEQPQACTPDDT